MFNRFAEHEDASRKLESGKLQGIEIVSPDLPGFKDLLALVPGSLIAGISTDYVRCIAHANKGDRAMRIGCQIGTWGDQDLRVEEAIAQMGAAGYQGIETFVHHLEPYYDKPAAFQRLLDDAGIALSSVYFGDTRFTDPEGEDPIVSKAAQACDFLGKVGCGFLVLNGGIFKEEGQTFSDAEFAQFAQVANRVGAESKARGVCTVLHPHLECMIESCEDLERLVEAGLDREVVSLCVHAAHQVYVKVDPYKIYEKYPDWVRFVHIGDSNEDGSDEILGMGVLDQERLHKPIFELGYDGWIIIEAAKEGVSGLEYADRARDHMKNLWPQVYWE
jgi:inosose dehydratase